MASLDDAQLLSDLFKGSDLAFGRSNVTNKISLKGKHETSSWTEKRPPTLEDWRRHVEGTAGLGIPPINSDSKVCFGAIDVDQYQGLSLEDLALEIEQSGFPLVLCRSKSGGPHLYLFVSEWVPASIMVEKLDMIAGFFGFGASEIFPKQVAIGAHKEHPDYGNWINMPYFDGARKFRYGLDKDGEPILGILDFVEHARSRMLTPAQLSALNLPEGAVNNGPFPQGPPCLNHIFKKGQAQSGNRNILLCNIAVYAKKAFPDTWKDKIEEYNRLFDEPLPLREIEAIKRSYSNKDYRYQCSKSPMCNYCNSQLCKNQEFGIDTGELLPNNRSLTVINTSPPVWYLDITTGENENRRISLSTDELQNPRMFQKRCIEILKIMPPIPKSDEWHKIIQGLLKHVTEIHIPEEMTPKGQLLEQLETFIINRGSSEDPEVLLRGLVFCGPREYWFRFADFRDYLQRNRFDSMKQNEITAILKTECKMDKGYQKIAGKGVRIIKIPREHLRAEPSEELTVHEKEEAF